MATQPDNTNPYLNARRQWNDHVGAVVAASKVWQGVGLISLGIAAIAVGGMVHLAGQSRFVPYVVEVDKLGQAHAVNPADVARPADPRVIQSTLASFIADARLVTPDVALQREAVFRVYAHLSSNDPATPKMNEWLNGSEEANPFKRAEKEMVGVEISAVLQQTESNWQVDWTETVRDRQGNKTGAARMRALITVYAAPPTSATKEEDIRKNPLGLFVKDFSWTQIATGDKP